ncbi:AGAP010484-PA, partial [Anopheles gambiae str. PEST]
TTLSLPEVLTLPPTPRRSIKHRNYKTNFHPVLTAGEQQKEKEEQLRKRKAEERREAKEKREEAKRARLEEREKHKKGGK